MKLNAAVQEIRRVANSLDAFLRGDWENVESCAQELRALARRIEAFPPACAHCEVPEYHEEVSDA